MKVSDKRLSRPLYEALPWLYITGGVLALILSYRLTSPVFSVLIGLPGFVALLGGIVIALRRKDYREMRTQYERPDALAETAREQELRTDTRSAQPGRK